jgi:hypothetical protein
MWKQCVTAYPGNFAGIQDTFETLFLAQGAPDNMALFSRTSDDFEHEIFLVSPAAAALTDYLEGEWTDAPDALDHVWSLLIANGNVSEKFGIRIGGTE